VGTWPFVARPGLIVAFLLIASSADAVEIPNVGGEPMAIDVVNTATGTYRFDNRNNDRSVPATYLDDHYGEFIERLDAQINWWRFQFGARIDADEYFNRPSATSLELLQKEQSGEIAFDSDASKRELNTRYLTTFYPSKIWLTYTQPGVELTVGDFYAQLGRGLVLSVRKLDELAIDTTVRGGKLVVDKEIAGVRLGATALAGQLNPLRVDTASGRRLHGKGSPLFFGFPDTTNVADLVTSEATVDAQGNPRTLRVIDKARPSYLEDTVVGGRLQAEMRGIELAFNGALLLRETYSEEYNRCLESLRDPTRPNDPLNDEQKVPGGRITGFCANKFPDFRPTTEAQAHNTIRSFGGSLNVPSIADHGDLYVEVMGQQLRDGHLDLNGVKDQDRSGYAIYAAANVRGGPVSLSLEGKHYRRYFPLTANIETDAFRSIGFNAPEFSAVAYSQPPTAEPIYTQPIGAPNMCVTGGRARVDYRFDRRTALYAWLGHYASFSELDDKNYDCETDDARRTNTWDTAVGTQIDFDDGRSHARAWAGARHAEVSATYGGFVNGPGNIFYSEGYVRYDIVKHLAGAFSLQAQGSHRHQYTPENYAQPWDQGEHYLALQWSPHIAAIFGYEYTAPPQGCVPEKNDSRCHYFNGGLQWKSGSSQTVLAQLVDTVQVFVGQRRPGLRCVSGVCRFFPAFEGARVDLISRF
jgi:hypothetical protein